jgi:Fe-S-cluster containining protein
VEVNSKSGFRFRCHPGLPCFTKCCRDVNIFLSPYDILRLKKRLGISSGEFLERYTISLIAARSGLPVVVLKMADDKDKRCPFVGSDGCMVYDSRPWSCRMYPLDRKEADDSFAIIADPGICLGLREESEQSVADYLVAQGVPPYEEMEGLLSRISGAPALCAERIQNPKLQEMCRVALYDLDRFRRFVMESRFLEIFYVEKEVAEKIPYDDLELMKLAFRWLEFGLVSGETMRIREDMLSGVGNGK